MAAPSFRTVPQGGYAPPRATEFLPPVPGVPEKQIGPNLQVRPPALDPERQHLVKQAALDIGSTVAFGRLGKMVYKLGSAAAWAAVEGKIVVKYGRAMNIAERLQFNQLWKQYGREAFNHLPKDLPPIVHSTLYYWSRLGYAMATAVRSGAHTGLLPLAKGVGREREALREEAATSRSRSSR
jgi:hypothetical protein